MRLFFSKLTNIALALSFFLVAGTAHAAAGATIVGSTDKSSYTVGDQLTLTVDANITDFTAGSVQVCANYDSSKLDFVSSSGDGSAFPNQFNSSSSGSSQCTTRFTDNNGTTGVSRIIRYTFKTKASGDVTFSFSNAQTAELGTGKSEPTGTASKTVTINNVSNSTPAPTAPPATPKPTTPTPKPATPKPATAAPTTAPSATPAPPDVSASQSTVTTNKDTAVADGVDAITMCVVVKRADGTVITDIQPTVTGLRPESDSASPMTFNSTDQSWCTNITSTAAGAVTTTIAASNVTITTKDLTFTAPPTITATPTPPPASGSGSSLLYIIIGIVLLLLLLLLLFFLYRRRKQQEEDEGLETTDDGTGPAYPGDETGASEQTGTETTAAPAPTDNQAAQTDDSATFNPNAALDRGDNQPPQQ